MQNGGNTQRVSSCPLYIFIELWLWEGFVLGGLSFVPWALTSLFCCTVVDVVFAQWGKHAGSEFFSMVYFYGSVDGGKGFILGGLSFVPSPL